MTSPIEPTKNTQHTGGSPHGAVPASIRKLWSLTDGRAWEPPNPTSPLVEKLVRDGWVRRVDGRCGFERFKDSMLTWTDAARAALSKAESR